MNSYTILMAGLYRFLGGYGLEPVQGLHVQPLKPQRVTWLLLYLAVQGTWVTREELQLMFWADSPNSAQNLRQVLYRLKQMNLENAIETNRHGLRFVAQSDVGLLREALKNQHFAEVLNLYRGELGFQIADYNEVPEFAAWLDLERTQWRNWYLEASLKQAHLLRQEYRSEAALVVLENALLQDPLNESLLEQLLQLCDENDFLQRGLDAIDRFTVRLEHDIGLALSANFEKWKQRLQQRLLTLVRAAPIFIPSVPQPTTPLLGRETELKALQTLDARVITLLGIGGIGKSRLAFEFVRLQGGKTFFVSLSTAQVGHSLAPLVAQVLGVQLPSSDNPELELQQALAAMDSALCLVLDNAESVLNETVALLETLLLVPALQVVVTSRQRLNVLGEHVFMVQGLPFPEVHHRQLDQFASVRLIITAARRNGSVFLSTPENIEAIAEITRIVQGVPLALELAAAWLRILTPQEVAFELEKNWGLLEETTLQLPPRQAGLKAVFDSTWALLTERQQQMLSSLAIFRGGFVFTAAKAVAGADHRTLLQLMDWALLKRLENGRYDLHPLIREYARVHLTKLQATQEAFNSHFVQLSRRSHQLPPDTLDEDVENLLLVWHHALLQQDENTLEVMTQSLFEVLFRLGRFPELQNHIRAALQISQTRRLKSILKAWRIEVHHNLSGVGQLEFDPQDVLLELEQQHLYFELALVHHTVGNQARETKQYTQALFHLEKSLEYARLIPFPYWESIVPRNIALVYERQNNRVAARRILTDMLEFEMVRLDTNTLAGIHNTLGELECREDHWEAAYTHFIKAEQYARIAKSNKVHAWTLENLGRVCLRNQDLPAAFEYLSAALTQFRNAGDILWVARVRCVLADAHQANHQPEAARLERLKGLRTAQELGAATVVWRCLRTWLPHLQLEQPQLASMLEQNLENDKVLLQYLPELIEYLEQPEGEGQKVKR
jgi:DNA-binding SARP family transcriptional activator/Tfp pilus assembly protein PilF